MKEFTLALLGLILSLVLYLIWLAVWGMAVSAFPLVVLVALLLAYTIAGIIELRAWLHERDFEEHATEEEKSDCYWWAVSTGRGAQIYVDEWRAAHDRDSAKVTLRTLFDSIASDRRGRIPAVVSIVLLCLAVYAQCSYWFYVLLRIVVSLSAIYLVFKAHALRKNFWAWVMGGVGIIFNPLVPLRLHRSDWLVLDLLTAVAFTVATVAFSRYALSH